jgi:KaiC/GvpD/RAD55 family RecA-like ATPase
LIIEHTIISNLMSSEEYARKVIPFLDKQYFSNKSDSVLIEEISSFYSKYNVSPTKEVLRIQLVQRNDLSDQQLKDSIDLVDSFDDKPQKMDWLIEQTEKFCKEKSVYNAILKSIKIIDGSDEKLSQDSIPKLLQDALSVSFDTAVGHSYDDDAESRYDFYTRAEERIPFDLKMLNIVTKGGLPRKSLTLVVAASGGGKSLFLCHAAASYLSGGKNVLYITMEMAEERIAERIDANLMNVDIDRLCKMSKDEFMTKIDKIKSRSHGKLVIKEYPTGAAHSGHFRGLIEELKIKKNFTPDILIVDYLGICASARLKNNSNANSYSLLKSVSEELRSLGVEYNMPVISAMQVNRSGFDNTDIELTSISESLGTIMTSDFVFSMIRTEELDDMGQTMIKILKNRYGDIAINRRFVVGINRSRMKLFDLEDSAQRNISESNIQLEQNDKPLFDKPQKSRDFSNFKF